MLGLELVPEGALLAKYFARGKMIRALVVFASTSAVGGDPARATHAAHAIELMHGASLFHDDVVDGADERRGLPALHRRVSESDAVLLGDLLLLRAFAVLAQSASDERSAASIVDAVRVVAELAQVCCRGQRLELELSNRPVSEQEYLAVAEGKTAAPFVAATMLGAIMGGASEGDRNRLAIYARGLGVAYQICDDMLDLCGERASLGKPPGNSLLQGRPLLPVIYLRTDGSPGGQREWDEARRRKAPSHELLGLLRREGIAARVKATQAAHVATALDALDGMADGEGVRMLRELPAAALRSCT